MDLEHIDLFKGVQRVLDKIKDFEENPQMDEEGNPKEYLDPTEKEMVTNLKEGRHIPHEVLIKLLNREFTKFE